MDRTSERGQETGRPAGFDRRQNSAQVDIVEHGIRIQADYGFVRAAKYMFQNGIAWPVIQRVLHTHVLRRPLKDRRPADPPAERRWH